MGQEYSAPQPGRKIRVIGAGFPRTGSASLSQALEILLDGPVYHGGTQATLGPEIEIKSWIKLLSQWPPTSEAQKQENLAIIRERLDGFVAVTDMPACSLVPELLELYPDAIVICTVRDPEKWIQSMKATTNVVRQWFLRFVFFPLPTLRYLVDFSDALSNQWWIVHRERELKGPQSWFRHIETLKATVPSNQLVFFDVKDGWEPLCRALDLPIPDVPFPRTNDTQAMEAFARKQIRRGLNRWAIILGSVAVVGAILRWTLV